MIRFHPKVKRDVTEAIRYYDQINDVLGDDFWTEFSEVCLEIESHPAHFHYDLSGWRRAGLERFPYHLLFYEESEGVRVMTLRHDKRHPGFGTRRQ